MNKDKMNDQVKAEQIPEQLLLGYWEKIPAIITDLKRSLEVRELEGTSELMEVYYGYLSHQMTGVMHVVYEELEKWRIYSQSECYKPIYVSLVNIFETILFNESPYLRADYRLAIRLQEQFTHQLRKLYKEYHETGSLSMGDTFYTIESLMNNSHDYGEFYRNIERRIVIPKEVVVDIHGDSIPVELNQEDLRIKMSAIIEICSQEIISCLSHIRGFIENREGIISMRVEDIKLPISSKEFPVFSSVCTYKVWTDLHHRSIPVTNDTLVGELSMSKSTVGKARDELRRLKMIEDRGHGFLIKNEYRLKRALF